MVTIKRKLQWMDEEGYCCEDTFELPAKYEVCDRCCGTGTHVHSDLSVWSAEAINEDPEGYEGMMRGHYDVRCTECNGLRVVPVVCREKLDEETARILEQSERADAEYERERHHQLRYGY